jgi:hypothetical protein
MVLHIALRVQDLDQHNPAIRYQMLKLTPRPPTAVERPNQSRIRRQVPHQRPKSPRRQSAPVEVEQIDPVFTQQVSLYLVPVLVEQETEAA